MLARKLEFELNFYCDLSAARSKFLGDVRVGGARGKFVSGAKVLAAVPRVWQPGSFISNF